MMKVALFGAGRIGRVHAASIQADGRSALACVTDVVREAAEALSSDFGVPARGADEVLADETIDAILIASSTNTHADLIEAGVAAGKAIFCEKPIDLDLSRALDVLRLTAGHDRPVMLGFNRRFDPNFAAMKEAYATGEIGAGELLAITSFDPAPPPVDYIKVSGGLYRDMTIHDFDMAAFFFGLPQAVMAHGANLVDSAIGAAGDIDTAVVTLSWADGRLATIRNSRRAAFGYDQRVELLGSTGMLQAENVRETTVIRSTADGVTAARPVHFFLERYARAYAIEWAAFVAAVLDGDPVQATVQDGVNALALAEAAHRSLEQGRPVELTPDMIGGPS